jgi:protein-tyrosine phosphatase
VKNIVVLLEDGEIIRYYDGLDLISFYQISGFHVTHFPIPDFSFPSNLQVFIHLLETIDDYLDTGSVFIHCSAGKGRSGTVAASFFVYKGMSLLKAVSFVREVNPHSIETSIQEEFVKVLHK